MKGTRIFLCQDAVLDAGQKQDGTDCQTGKHRKARKPELYSFNFDVVVTLGRHESPVTLSPAKLRCQDSEFQSSIHSDHGLCNAALAGASVEVNTCLSFAFPSTLYLSCRPPGQPNSFRYQNRVRLPHSGGPPRHDCPRNLDWAHR